MSLRQRSPCPESLASFNVLNVVLTTGQHYIGEALKHGAQEGLPRGLGTTLKTAYHFYETYKEKHYSLTYFQQCNNFLTSNCYVPPPDWMLGICVFIFIIVFCEYSLCTRCCFKFFTFNKY